MRALSSRELLDVWERGLPQPPAGRALLLLEAACPETPPGMLARWSVGQRDAALLKLREWAFGSPLASLAVCPACAERVELNFDTSDIRAFHDAEPPETFALAVCNHELLFRLPDSRDLDALAGCADVDAARAVLLERCVLSARLGDTEVAAAELPPEVVAALAGQMERADPQADVELDLCCPHCGHGWRALFDIASFFWDEVHAWAQRLLREVHILAAAYGWREADTLALSPWRRRFYVEMASG